MNIIQPRENFKSDVEWYFSWWLDDFKKEGAINEWFYESNSFTLSDQQLYPVSKVMKTKIKIVTHELLKDHTYRPDFLVEWNEDWNKKLWRLVDDATCERKVKFFAVRSSKTGKPYTFFEVKGDFDRNNMTRLFTLNQKWLYSKYGLYVTLVKLPTLFKQTFVPERYFVTDKTMQERIINFPKMRVQQFLKQL